MWTNLLFIYFVLVCTCTRNTAQIIAPLDEGDCCDQEASTRVPCPAGGDLHTASCLENGCCHDDGGDGTDAPACFARKERPCGRCKVNPVNRTPCGYWSETKEFCEEMGCCYDKQTFPYCYRTADKKPRIMPLPNRNLEPVFDATPPPRNSDYWKAYGPEEKYFNPVFREMLEVYCPTEYDRKRCGHRSVNRDECIDQGCCWNPSLGNPVCFYTHSKAKTNGPVLDAVMQQFVQRNKTTDESHNHIDASPVSQFSYENVSVTLECPLVTDRSTKKSCHSSTRALCMEENCCWMNERCVAPYTHFKEAPKDPVLPEQALLANDWVSASIDMYVENTTLQVMCHSVRTPVRCGPPGINRTECIIAKCCWQPELLLKENNDIVCTLPVIRENEKTQSDVVDENMAQWGDWQTWSECTATEQGTPLGGKRVRRRECFAKERKNNGVLSCNGAASESMDCRDPNGCILGDWSGWTRWSKCSPACSPGTQKRYRRCAPDEAIDIDPECDECDDAFIPTEYDQMEERNCNEDSCPKWLEWTEGECICGVRISMRTCDLDYPEVDLLSHDISCYNRTTECPGECYPKWEEWGPWSPCSLTCAVGTRDRNRICVDAEGLETTGCAGGGIDTEQCNTELCHLWSDWTPEGDCEAECEGTALQRTTRSCMNPPDFASNDECTMTYIQCNGSKCFGDWEWTPWSECEDTCGPSAMNRTRYCVYKGQIMEDMSRCMREETAEILETAPCNEVLCHKWGDWVLEDDCSAPCRGNGLQTKSRPCLDDDKTPLNLGETHDESCYKISVECEGVPTCPPTWTDWSDWSPCSESCTVGTRTKTRSCVDDDGLEVIGCPGDDILVETCNEDQCTTWGDWERIGECDANCEERGNQKSTRICLDPEGLIPTYEECRIRDVPCNGSRCMGDWATWSPYSACEDACSPAFKTRTRSCVFNSEETDDLTRCIRDGELENEESAPCNENMCQIWGEWFLQDDCNAPCRENGSQTNLRACLDDNVGDLAEFHPLPCFMTKEICQGAPTCPPEWTEWGNWSTCSESCIPGLRNRERVCRSEFGFEDDGCPGEKIETESCNLDSCHEWGDWELVGECVAPCEEPGEHASVRTCISPPDFTAIDNSCSSRTAPCDGARCLGDWDTWSTWSSCYDSCAPSHMNRTRHCVFEDELEEDVTRCHRDGDIANRESIPCNENMCHNWGEWILEDDCDAACRNTGVQTSSRKCADDMTNENFIAFHEASCYTEKVECSGPPICPPAWSTWGEWSECSDSCSVGQKMRSRTCLTEDGAEVDECDGFSTDTEECNTNLCEEWGNWELSGECDAECETPGTQRSTRTCITPPDVISTTSCTERLVPCNGSVCFGDWDTWKPWSNCFDTCGPSFMNRTRDCILKGEIVDASRCHSENGIGSVGTQSCNDEMCANWSTWQLEDDCDAPCRGIGTQTNSRYCLDSVANAFLAEVHNVSCYRVSVHCNGAPTCPPSWDEWGSWSACSELCTHGVETRSRVCLTEDGEEVDECQGENIMSQTCNTDLCQEWGEWVVSGSCDGDCEEQGLQLTTRMCINPPGFVTENQNCDRQFVSCTGPRCLGDWDNWSEWTDCNSPCSPSTQNRTRHCIFEGAIQDDLTRCHRDGDISSTEEIACNVNMCQEWGDWALENDCDAPCRGTGLETMSRSCLNLGEGLLDLSLFPNESCFSTKVPCNGAPTCPPSWNDWGEWTTCSQSCAVGETSRYRVCLTEESVEVDECEGAAVLTKVCNEDLCLEWGNWEKSEDCDAECEKPGVQQNRRHCINPPGFLEDNEDCQIRYDACTGPRCFGDWDNWSTWSACHDQCGPSTKNRTRYCMFKGEMTNDVTRCHRDGISSDIDTDSCNEFLCHTWGEWELKDDCNAPCRGNGTQTQSRRCDDTEVSEEFLATLHDRSCYTLKIECLGAPVCPPTWTEWGEWSSCSESCTSGVKTRQRLCLTEDGLEVNECGGAETQQESCNDNLCVAWGDWEDRECDAECESNGTRLVVRLCTFQPQFNEQLDKCNSRNVSCIGPRCMGEWNEWKPWSDCYDNCGPSTKNRTRSCIFRGDSTDDLTRCVVDGNTADVETITCNENMCHLWTEWTLENDCDAPCRGTGLQTLSRNCQEVHLTDDILSVFHNESCYNQQVQCDGAPTCPPAWNEWGEWTPCSQSCAVGETSRYRVCLTEESVEVDECEGAAVLTKVCNEDLCLEWGNWEKSEDCDAECEKPGVQQNRRHCINPPGFLEDNEDCQIRYDACTGPRCFGDWDNWSTWSACHDQCGPSTKNRTRYCMFKGEMTNDVTRCHRDGISSDIDTDSCNEFLCHTWGEWELKDDCNAPCRGNGTQTQSRRCDDTEVSEEFLATLHDRSCYTLKIECLGAPVCPPTWTEWGEWSSCSESCTSGVKTRQRLCLTEDGLEVNECGGAETQQESCNDNLCVAWGDWEDRECDAECESNGTRLEVRLCTFQPQFNEQLDKCNSRNVSCIGPRCMGEWNEWKPWSDCYDNCGPSTKNRTRSCIFRGDSTDDLTRCVVDGNTADVETITCNENMCHLWTEWTLENDCDAPCRGTGLQTLSRNCQEVHLTDDILSVFHNESCYNQQVQCDGAPTCPPAWNEWGNWSECSESCTSGLMTRNRICLTESGVEVNECEGPATESETCNDDLCLEWNEWQLDGTCNAECEMNGTRVSTRDCINPPNLNPGRNDCNYRLVSCTGSRCMGNWSEWNDWSDCHDACGPSTQNRTRSCVFRGEDTDDFSRCSKSDDETNVQTLLCNDFMCHAWDEWKLQDDCDAPCRGNGSQTKSRLCEDQHVTQDDLLTFHAESCFRVSEVCFGAPTCPPSWNEWGPWSTCSKSCTNGIQQRQRFCFTEDGVEVNECAGPEVETANCNHHLCLDWGEWEVTGECNAECETNGTQISTRICINPLEGQDEPNECNTVESMCLGPRCMGDWDGWTSWSECNSSCEPSLKNRTRACVFNGEITDDISRCVRDGELDVETMECNEGMCHKWTEWNSQNDCNAPCRGIGLQTMARSCEDIHMTPDLLTDIHEQSCYQKRSECSGTPTCPPAWTDWEPWSVCSQSCTSGTRLRQRQCLTETGEPVDQCDGSETEIENCNENLCLEYSEWRTVGECNAECEKDGSQFSVRVCLNPPDFFEVQNECNSRSEDCVGSRCLGDWDTWSQWTECQDPCSPSLKNRSRVCLYQGNVTDDMSRCHDDITENANVDIRPCNEFMCRDWGEWEIADDCDALCRANGSQTKSRACDDNTSWFLLAAFHEQSCYRTKVDCMGAPTCPPAWNEWGSWSSCSQSCTTGTRKRRRLCYTEDAVEVDECAGDRIETEACNENLCLEWNEWQPTGDCNAECETNGTQLLTRSCENPIDFNDASDICNSRYITCTGERCMGDWNEWSAWSECQENCGPGVKNRYRSCIFNGNTTEDLSRCHREGNITNADILPCNELMCHAWGNWTLQNDCDAPCRGTGQQTRSRSCIDDDITNGDLEFFHSEDCYRVSVECLGEPTCPPTWSEWDEWSECSESCTIGNRIRRRQCLTENGDPSDECVGSDIESETCNDDLCLAWNEWQVAGTCDAECEKNGTYPSTRTCFDPPDFIDSSLECITRQVACTGPRCMGAWDDWSPWTDCLDNCSPSFSNRTRVCILRDNITTDITRCQNNPNEPNVETLSCNEFLCRDWDEWTFQGDCNALCRGIGLETRIRNCLDEGVTSDDLSSFHEESCYSERVFCNGPPVCPPTWSDWDNWSECNESCTVGMRTRSRRCLNETGTEVDECNGPAVDTEICNDHLCIEWSDWQIVGDCNADCEETGTQPTTRVCINPPDYNHNNDDCVSRLASCTGPRCLGDWVSWSSWSGCYDSCSPSTMNRTRHCIYKGETTEDLTRCLPEGNITMHHSIDCNENMCQTWSNWTLLDDCNAPCRGSGLQTNVRKCLDDEKMEEVVAQNHDALCYSVQVSCLGTPTCPPAWSEWGNWSRCSETCSNGTKNRNRQCLTETGEPTDTCVGAALDVGQCNQDLCLEWEDWQLVGECNAECEQNGTERYSRNCANPLNLVFDQDSCNIKFESCVGARCMGDWNDWSSWSDCRESCGPAFKQRERQCVYNGEVTDDLTRCQESNELGLSDTLECNERMCSEWAEWGLRDDCDAPCRGTGNQTRSRKCASISFTDDVLGVLHPESCFKLYVSCEGEPTCPPAWNDWASWSDCSETCSRGVKTRDRQCISEFGELTTGCPGTNNDVQLCNEDLCVTWGNWDDIGKCDALCEQNGTQRYERPCVDPVNFNSSNEECNVKHQSCTGDICLGDWGTWGAWSDCEDSCSPSVARRNRDCIVKGEKHNEVFRCYRDGEKGSLTQSRVCNQLLCPQWGDWIINDDCNAPCRGKGVRSRLRNCTIFNDGSTLGATVALDAHNKDCYSTEVPCEGAPTCPPEWSTWGNWSTCSQSCSVGLIYRQRLCITEFGEQTDISNCQGDAREEEHCNTHLCKVWNDWDKALSCDADCEEPGFKWSLRACRDQTIPVETANECFQNKEACMGGPCPGSWGPWSQWSDCQDRCGPSVQNRSRSCYLKGELVDNSRCVEGEPSETSTCNEIYCTNWMRWKEGNCTGVCGQKGTYKRERACLLSLTSLVRGDELETTFPGMPEDCYLKKIDCIVECIPQWTLWSEWSSCSTSCAPGEKVRTRECFYNESRVDPKHCTDPRKIILRDVFSPDGSSHRAPCNLDMCLTWSQWSGKCSANCGEPGILVKRRQCRFAINGDNVVADVRNQAIAKCSTEQVPCTGDCIANWLPWSSWSRCSESCGPAVSMRTRVCHSQGRKVDERFCLKNGDMDESEYRLVRTCNSEVCNSWTSWSGLQCSARCGAVGRRHKRRICNGTGELRPLTSPLNDLSCFNVIERCTTPVGDVSYSNWLPWTRCTSSCGNGVRRRFRTCKGQSGCRVISTDCRKFGSSNERQTCNLSGCLRFSPWADGKCSATCGATGNIERTRRCLVGADVPVPVPRASCFSLTRPCRGSCP